jgi:GTP diphosphokinase / guanosine-3',5'-bis(diphosphate) 3'-diphosphatase
MIENGARPDAVTLTMGRYGQDAGTVHHGVVTIDGSEGSTVRMAQCCRPIPGDAIVGYLGRGEGLTVHTSECPVGRRLFDRDREQWLAVEWAEAFTRNFDTMVVVDVQNGQGALASIAQAVSNAGADVTHIEMDNQRKDEATAELRLTLSVRDRQHLADVLRGLKRTAVVLRAARSRT